MAHLVSGEILQLMAFITGPAIITLAAVRHFCEIASTGTGCGENNPKKGLFDRYRVGCPARECRWLLMVERRDSSRALLLTRAWPLKHQNPLWALRVKEKNDSPVSANGRSWLVFDLWKGRSWAGNGAEGDWNRWMAPHQAIVVVFQ
jgi:hypothetical protein